MASVGWVIEYDDAYRVWVVRHRPSLEEETDMVAWFADCERSGPPDVEPDPKGNLTTDGPRGERIYYRAFDVPDGDPVGYMLVLSIG